MYLPSFSELHQELPSRKLFVPFSDFGAVSRLRELGRVVQEEYSDGGTERGRRLRQAICDKFHFASLEFQSLEGVIKAIGLPACELCTYCWNGKE